MTVTPYLFRHAFATLSWLFKLDKDVARRVLRHRDSKMLDQVYCRLPHASWWRSSRPSTSSRSRGALLECWQAWQRGEVTVSWRGKKKRYSRA